MKNKPEYLLKDGRRVLIRQAEEKDIKSIIDIMSSVASEGLYSPALTISKSHKEHIAKAIKQRTSFWAVTELNGLIVGECNLSSGSSIETEPRITELGMNIRNEFREIGIGNAMMDFLIEQAKEKGYEKIVLSVLATNSRAINLYKKHGFAVEGVRKKQFKFKDDYVDEVLMAKFL